MTFEDVKRIWQSPSAEDCDNKELSNLIDIALEKQIPKKPIPHTVEPIESPIKIGNANWCKGTTIYYCPNCKDFISRVYTYCTNAVKH